MTSFILYNNTKRSEKSPDDYLVKQVDDLVFKRLLFNEIHKKFSFQVQRSQLPKTALTKLKVKNDKNTNVTDLVNVILMPELSERQLKTYLNTYNDEPDNLKKYAEYLAIISYNQVNPNRFQVKKHFQKLLEEQSTYWEDDYNCNITLNDIFVKRKFNYDIYSKKLIQKAGFGKLESRMKNIKEGDLNYLNELDRYQDKEALFKQLAAKKK